MNNKIIRFSVVDSILILFFSIAALCKLLEYGISSNDVILNSMTVKGEQIFDDNAGVKTRSQQRTFEWTTIPFLVKIYKLIVSECAYVMESEFADEQNNLVIR